MKALRFAACAALVWISQPGLAIASESEDITARYTTLWRTAVRFVRADLQMEVTDRDKETGYILFTYEERDRRYPASMEFVRRPQRSKPRDESDSAPAPTPAEEEIRITVQVRGMPSYVERLLINKLRKKIDRERAK